MTFFIFCSGRVGSGVGVEVGTGVGVKVTVGVWVGVKVAVAVGVFVGDGDSVGSKVSYCRPPVPLQALKKLPPASMAALRNSRLDKYFEISINKFHPMMGCKMACF